MINVLVGTNNQGKFGDAVRMADQYPNLKLYKPSDLGITTDPEETGNTYTENAHIKRDFYLSEIVRLGLKNYYVLGDDSGLEIDALDGEPGIHSRRWRDGKTTMSDQEIIDYVIERMENVPADKRTAVFAGIIALGHSDKGHLEDIAYRLEGTMLETPETAEIEAGYPFRALFYLPQYGELLATISHQAFEDRPEGFLSHRELGMKAAFDKITQLEPTNE